MLRRARPSRSARRSPPGAWCGARRAATAWTTCSRSEPPRRFFLSPHEILSPSSVTSCHLLPMGKGIKSAQGRSKLSRQYCNSRPSGKLSKNKKTTLTAAWGGRSVGCSTTRQMDFSKASPLTLLMPVIPGTSIQPLAATLAQYQGKLDKYIQDFVSQVGTIFDALLQFVVGGPQIIPVANHVQAFETFITLNDASQHPPNTGLYQAYTATVQEVLAALGWSENLEARLRA